LLPVQQGRALVILGEASYGMYILQSPVFIWMKAVVALALFGNVFGGASLNRSPLFVVAYGIVLTMVSVATLYCYEVPARRAVKQFFRRRQPLVVEGLAPASR
jgi:peptidoglycan/LPS O-acetylase OafA/YrhL